MLIARERAPDSQEAFIRKKSPFIKQDTTYKT
jgi:hypothetical protein